MNINSIRWATTAGRQRCTDPAQLLVLLTVAASVDRRHEGCVLTVPQLAATTLLAEREAGLSLASIVSLGLIPPGDQNLSAGFPIDDRPVVWDLNADGRKSLPLQGRASGHPAMRLPGAVYRFLNAGARRLYIGTTVEIDQRWPHHRSKSWWPEVADIEVVWYPTLREAWFAEQDAIHREVPIHNVARYRSAGVAAA